MITGLIWPLSLLLHKYSVQKSNCTVSVCHISYERKQIYGQIYYLLFLSRGYAFWVMMIEWIYSTVTFVAHCICLLMVPWTTSKEIKQYLLNGIIWSQCHDFIRFSHHAIASTHLMTSLKKSELHKVSVYLNICWLNLRLY